MSYTEWPGRSLFVTLNALFWCPWRWPNSPSALQSTNKSEAPPWVPLWALLFAWWSSPSRRKSGTEPTALLWPHWTFQLAYFVVLTTDCVLQILGLRNLLCQFSAPGVLRPPHHFGNGTRSGVPGLCIEFEPFALRYSPPRDFNQVMAPFSASPLAVQLSGFVSRLFLVAKCAHPAQERTRGFAALHRLHRAAGFYESDLTAAAKPIRRYLHTSSLW